MSKQTEAMKLARDALKKCHYYMIDAGLPNQSMLNEAFAAYKALDEALAELPAQQEPVAKVYRHGKSSNGTPWHGVHWFDEGVNMPDGTKLYTTPQPPAQPLTDEEIDSIIAADPWTCDVEGEKWKAAFIRISRAIEAAHGITKGNT